MVDDTTQPPAETLAELTVREAIIVLDVFLAAYARRPDDMPVYLDRDDDNLLRWGHLRTILAALTGRAGGDAGADEVERVAMALGLHRQPGGKDASNPPTRWPTGVHDTLSSRDGTVPLTWDFAEQCRADARVMLAALTLYVPVVGRTAE